MTTPNVVKLEQEILKLLPEKKDENCRDNPYAYAEMLGHNDCLTTTASHLAGKVASVEEIKAKLYISKGVTENWGDWTTKAAEALQKSFIILRKESE